MEKQFCERAEKLTSSLERTDANRLSKLALQYQPDGWRHLGWSRRRWKDQKRLLGLESWYLNFKHVEDDKDEDVNMFSYSSCFFVYISAFNGRSSQNFLFVAITYVIQLWYVLLKQAISRCIKFQKAVDGVHWRKVMILNLTFYCFQTPAIQVTYMPRQYGSTVLGWNMKW